MSVTEAELSCEAISASKSMLCYLLRCWSLPYKNMSDFLLLLYTSWILICGADDRNLSAYIWIHFCWRSHQNMPKSIKKSVLLCYKTRYWYWGLNRLTRFFEVVCDLLTWSCSSWLLRIFSPKFRFYNGLLSSAPRFSSTFFQIIHFAILHHIYCHLYL